MDLSFININDNGYATFSTYSLPSELISIIKDSMDCTSFNQCVFSFGRFVDFDKSYHGKALEYFLAQMITTLERQIIGEDMNIYQVNYKFSNKDDITHNLQQKQMLFLCAILHHLNIKPHLLALSNILLDMMTFQNIVAYAKDDKFTMRIYTK